MITQIDVAPREGRVSRNCKCHLPCGCCVSVAPREGRVSRNPYGEQIVGTLTGRAPRGACE